MGQSDSDESVRRKEGVRKIDKVNDEIGVVLVF